jgi:hypothetical protein
MLKQRPTLDIIRSNSSQVRAQANKVKSHFIQSASANIADCYHLHCFESATEYLKFIDSLLSDIYYLFPVAERVEGGVHGTNPTDEESKTSNEWLVRTSLPGGINPAVNQYQLLSSGK